MNRGTYDTIIAGNISPKTSTFMSGLKVKASKLAQWQFPYIPTLKIIQPRMIRLHFRKGHYSHQDLLIRLYIIFFYKSFRISVLLRVDEIRSSHDCWAKTVDTKLERKRLGFLNNSHCKTFIVLVHCREDNVDSPNGDTNWIDPKAGQYSGYWAEMPFHLQRYNERKGPPS